MANTIDERFLDCDNVRMADQESTTERKLYRLSRLYKCREPRKEIITGECDFAGIRGLFELKSSIHDMNIDVHFPKEDSEELALKIEYYSGILTGAGNCKLMLLRLSETGQNEDLFCFSLYDIRSADERPSREIEDRALLYAGHTVTAIWDSIVDASHTGSTKRHKMIDELFGVDTGSKRR